MGQNSSKAQLPTPPPTVAAPAVPAPTVTQAPMTPGFARAQTMLDVAQFSTATSESANAAAAGIGGLPRSSSDTALNTSTMTACQKAYQQSLEWGRNEQFLKLAHTFHTNNY